ncbi:phage tail tube protein [Sphingobium sp. WW5]|uniref:phage tail tube protein n=1 Tax=unclassified Sphingobium TaxID=2611147 RepID=UPI003C241BF4
MASGAIHSRKTKIEITDGSTKVQIKGLTNFSGLGGGSASVIDVTDLDSDAKEKMIGLADEGQVSLSLNYLPTDPGQVALEEARLSGELSEFVITLRSGATYSFSAAVLSFEKSGGVDAVITGSVTLEVSGLVVKGTAA